MIDDPRKRCRNAFSTFTELVHLVSNLRQSARDGISYFGIGPICVSAGTMDCHITSSAGATRETQVSWPGPTMFVSSCVGQCGPDNEVGFHGIPDLGWALFASNDLGGCSCFGGGGGRPPCPIIIGSKLGCKSILRMGRTCGTTSSI